MITLLSGGTGTPKLIQGLTELIDETRLAVIVNTAEDKWLSHGYFSPDVDTVVYTLAGVIDDSTWHGLKDDTHHTHDALQMLGSFEYLKIGDRDRAVHIWRGEKMKTGETLSQVTKEHCRVLGVGAKVIPMSDDVVKTSIETPEGGMDLHEFWVRNRGEPEVEGVVFKGLRDAAPCKEAVESIMNSERIIIGPSNPVTSIHPIISLQGVNEALKKKRDKTICLSPIIGESAFSGPAEKLMRSFGITVSPKGVAEFYRSTAKHFVMDGSEDTWKIDDVMLYRADILMDSMEKKRALAKFILDIEL